jgi:hypothetical protein
VATWTLLHMNSPLNTTAGSGQIGELTKASSRKFTFSAEESAALSFDMPGNHPQTAALTPLVDDVLAFRDDYPVQRFRVVSRAFSKDSGVLKASFTGLSYRALLEAWILHDGDTRSWTASAEQTAIAWAILNEGQAKTYGNLGISRGILPATSVNRTLTGSVAEGFTRPDYLQAGMKRSEAIDGIAGLSNGFEWDIEPNPDDPYRTLLFNTWNTGGRNQHVATATGRSPLVLDDGGSVASWTHTVTPTDYANVVRFTGAEPTASFVVGGTSGPTWQPTSQDPDGTPTEGRWERDLSDSDLTTQATAAAAAPTAYNQAHLYVPEITCALRRGRWQGPAQLWLGDQARLIITEPVKSDDGRPLSADAPQYVLYVDEDVRVVELDIDVDDLGAEDVSLSLNRRKFSTRRNSRNINDRLNRLERR